jgi:2-keto-3-deoxy-L-rhamnonate aldolase RhmA
VVAAAVARARYQPEGLRSYGGQRYGMRPAPDDPAEVRPAIYAMLETRRGVEAIGEIAAVPGLAGLHVGPTDLGLALGVGRDQAAPEFRAAIAAIVAAGHANGLPVTMHAVAAHRAAEWIALGFDELVLTTDIELLRGAFAELIDGARRGAASAVIAPAAGR